MFSILCVLSILCTISSSAKTKCYPKEEIDSTRWDPRCCLGFRVTSSNLDQCVLIMNDERSWSCAPESPTATPTERRLAEGQEYCNRIMHSDPHKSDVYTEEELITLVHFLHYATKDSTTNCKRFNKLLGETNSSMDAHSELIKQMFNANLPDAFIEELFYVCFHCNMCFTETIHEALANKHAVRERLQLCGQTTEEADEEWSFMCRYTVVVARKDKKIMEECSPGRKTRFDCSLLIPTKTTSSTTTMTPTTSTEITSTPTASTEPTSTPTTSTQYTSTQMSSTGSTSAPTTSSGSTSTSTMTSTTVTESTSTPLSTTNTETMTSSSTMTSTTVTESTSTPVTTTSTRSTEHPPSTSSVEVPSASPDELELWRKLVLASRRRPHNRDVPYAPHPSFVDHKN